LALDASFKVRKGKKEKIVPASEFFVLPNVDETKENILEKDEILTEIIVPPASGDTVSKYIKVKERGAWDFALASISGVFNTDGKVIKKGKIAFGGVAPVPWIDEQVNENLTGMRINEKNFSDLASIALSGAYALEMNTYKLALSKNLVKKLLIESFIE
jgi:xanthine dehydrogenase YagS FAD-binding subunit